MPPCLQARVGTDLACVPLLGSRSDPCASAAVVLYPFEGWGRGKGEGAQCAGSGVDCEGIRSSATCSSADWTPSGRAQGTGGGEGVEPSKPGAQGTGTINQSLWKSGAEGVEETFPPVKNIFFSPNRMLIFPDHLVALIPKISFSRSEIWGQRHLRAIAEGVWGGCVQWSSFWGGEGGSGPAA